MRRLILLLCLTAFIWLGCSGCDKSSATSPEITDQWPTPADMLKSIPRGINIGNTLEPETEGGWNNGPMKEYYFDDIAAAGFNCVRIPVRWDKHTAGKHPFAVSEAWMTRVEQVIDWALERNLVVILNAHHEWWVVNHSSIPDTLARFDSIWAQIANRFQKKSPNLMFEMINEPHGMPKNEVDSLNARVLRIIRKSNPRRIVIFSGHEWSNAEQLVEAAVPQDDHLMAYYHSYDPWIFAGEGKGTWGTESDLAAMAGKYDMVQNWSDRHDVPVMISEFGAVIQCDYNSRMRHYMRNVELALTHHVAFLAWDDGGMFGIYNREQRTWSEVKDILIHTYPDGPVLLTADMIGQNAVHLQWENRQTNYSKIWVQRKTGEADFITLEEIDGSSEEYFDEHPTHLNHIYRIIARASDGKDRYSNPYQVTGGN